MISPLVIGRVKEGKLAPRNVATLKAAFACHEGCDVEFQVKRHRKNRSLNQNALYWSQIVPAIGNAIGEDDPQSVHEMLKMEHNYHIVVIGKKEIRIPDSTADLDTKDFSDYMERVRRWAAQFLNLWIDDPHGSGSEPVNQMTAHPQDRR